jgi:hypothetical protein
MKKKHDAIDIFIVLSGLAGLVLAFLVMRGY